jgi:hypothetical protein
MSTIAALPPVLRDKLASLSRRLRLLRAVRGLSWLLLLLTVTGGAALLADHFLSLSAPVRIALLTGWITLGVVTTSVGLLGPLFRRIDPEALAAVIEQKYPDLGERLTSAVELSGDPDVYHGSPALIALLMHETETRTHRLNFLQAVPAGAIGAFASVTAVVVMLALAPVVVFPQQYAQLGKRFLFPWHAAPVVAPYTVEVTPGDVFAARGRTLAFNAHVVPAKPNTPLPQTCTLVLTDADGNVTRRPMLVDRRDAFSLTIDRVAGSGRYRVEAGEAASPEYTLTAVDPVELAAESPTITVTPPDYAKQTVQVQTAHGLPDLSALQHSRVQFDFRFTAPASAAFLIWSSPGQGHKPVDAFVLGALGANNEPTGNMSREGLIRQVTMELTGQTPTPEEIKAFEDDRSPEAYEKLIDRLLASPLYGERWAKQWLDVARLADNCRGSPGGQPSATWNYRDYVVKSFNNEKKTRGDVYMLTLAGDRLSATLELPAEANGTYKLLLLAEHDIATEFDARPLTVQVDQPPTFTKISLGEELKAVLPYDRLPIEMTLNDDIGVAEALIEFRVNEEAVQVEPIQLEGRNTQEATAKHFFTLGGKVKPGDEVHYRLKAVDNRSLPEKNLKPNETYYPARDRWLTIKVAKQAESVKEQEITAQRDEIQKRLEAIKTKLQHELRALYKLRQDARADDNLKPDQASNLKDLKKENRTIEEALRDVAREASAPPLQKIAEQAQSIADQEMQRSGEDLRNAEKEKKAPPREEQFQKADQELVQALQRIDEMQKANEKVAKERLDLAKLEMMVEREKQLADRAAELAAKDPVKEPEAGKELEQLKREQNEVANELQKLAESSETLKNALDAARAQQAQELAQRAKELAQAERDLAQAERDTDPRRPQLDELARKQQQLAEQAAKLAKETQPATQAAKANPLKPDDAQKATEALKQGDASEAVRLQDKAARELDRVATDLDRAIDLAKDPREAARQLARIEQGLQQRTEEAQKKDAGKPPAERLADLQKEQQAVQRAADRLPVPAQNEAAQKDRQEAAQAANQAADALKRQDAREAGAKMEQARKALEHLADSLPSLAERQQQARAEVGRLRQQQEQIDHLAQQAVKQVDKDDPNAAKTRAQLAEKLTDAARRQAETAERLSKLDPANQEARQQQAQEALNRALADLMDARPQDIAASQQTAKRELDRLQKALSGEKPGEDKPVEHTAAKPNESSPKQMAQELAKQQKDLAKATQKAQQQAESKPGEEGKKALQQALEKMSQQQQDLNEKASQLPANQQQKALEQAREAMNQAQQSLVKNDAAQAQQKQREAASALEKLAQQLGEQRQTAQKPDAQPDKPQTEAMPNKQQTEQARQLAQQQRDLREEVQKLAKQANANPPKESPLGELAKQQQEIAKQTSELARNVAQEQGEKAPPSQQAQQAAQAAQQTANQVEAGALQKAQQSGQQTAQQLRQLAQKMSETPRGKNADPQAVEPVKQARDLAQKQEEVNRQMEQQAANPEAQQAQQAARQQELEKKAGELENDVNKLAQQMQRQPQQLALQAAKFCKDCQNAMGQAGNQVKQGNQGQAQQQQQQAAQNLDRAAEQLAQAAQQMQAQQQPGGQPSPQAGKAVQAAQGQMQQAQQQLGQNKPQGAQGLMQQAAQALQQAAQQLGQQQPSESNSQPMQNTTSGPRGASGDGRIDESLLSPDMKKHAGKRWGELPGELQTKIIQDMKAKYGDDYARVIKLYFEQIADTKRQ